MCYQNLKIGNKIYTLNKHKEEDMFTRYIISRSLLKVFLIEKDNCWIASFSAHAISGQIQPLFSMLI